MATFLETLGLLNYFSALFAALLVFAVVFSLLSQTKIFGNGKVIQGIISIVLAILVLIYPDLINLVNFVAPWFVLVFIFVVLLLLVYRTFGVSESNIADFVRGDRTVNWVILAVGILILLAGVFNVFGQRALQQQGPTVGDDTTVGSNGQQAGFQSNLFTTLFSPKVLGMILVFAIAIFSVAFLGGAGPLAMSGGGGGGGHH